MNHEIESTLYDLATTQRINIGSSHAFNIYQHLRQKWPQINERTKIQNTRYMSVYVHRPSKSVNWFPRMIWSPLNILKTSVDLLFEKGNLDDPDSRWNYQVRVWKLPFKTMSLYWFRIAGKLFRRKDWERRTEIQTPDPMMIPPTVDDGEELHLEKFLWTIELPLTNDFPYTYRLWMACVYHPGSDTLWVYR